MCNTVADVRLTERKWQTWDSERKVANVGLTKRKIAGVLEIDEKRSRDEINKEKRS